MTQPSATSIPQNHGPHAGLGTVSFVGLLFVQGLTVFNDHAFRWLAVPLIKRLIPAGGSLQADAAVLALMLGAFTLPYLLLSTTAGFLADRYCKATVITWCKFAEMLILAGGLWALSAGAINLLFFVVALTGAISALFAPSRQGSIPELVRDSRLSQANGWMGLMNVAPCALGFWAGNALASQIKVVDGAPVLAGALGPAVTLIMSVAVIGWLASLFIQRRPPGDPERMFRWNLFAETIDSLGSLSSQPAMFRCALGIACFWILASSAQLNVDLYGNYDLQLGQVGVGYLGVALVGGVGVGCLLAGYLSGGRVELGLTPIGALGISACAIALFVNGWLLDDRWQASLAAAMGILFLMGVFSGLFDVPLEAYLQYRADPRHLGQVLAGANFLCFSGTLLVSILFYAVFCIPGMTASTFFLGAGLATAPLGVFIVLLIPAAAIRAAVLLLSHLVYRVRVIGREHVPLKSGCLLISNHVSWIDGVLLMLYSPRPIRFLVYSDYVYNPRLYWLAKMFEVIPIKSDGGPKALMQSIKLARESIEDGHAVWIFPEGQLTRTGQMQPFSAGFLKILQGTGAPLIPAFLDRLWGSIFSFRGGKFFKKWPREFPYHVTIQFGPAMEGPLNVHNVSAAVQRLGVSAVQHRKSIDLVPVRQFLRSCRQSLFQTKISDSTGQTLTGGKLLTASLCLRHVLVREILGVDERQVGILLPPSLGGALANVAVSLARRVAVNLNYTLGDKDLQFCVRDAGLKHIITSRKVLEKRPIELDAQWIFIEDIRDKLTRFDRVMCAIQAFAMPAAFVEWRLRLSRILPDEPMTIIYTSGSTGEPKGVTLSHNNIRSNADAADHLFQIDEQDMFLGLLPFFHSFGYTITLWLPLMTRARAVYHYNPLDARQVGKLAHEFKINKLFATPTFLRSYLKRCEAEQFKTLDLVVVGAEKMPLELAQQFQQKFGVEPTEGYGCTELSPLASVNGPDFRSGDFVQKGGKAGTVGRPVPGVAARVIDPDSGAELPPDHEGLLEVAGPNVMLGYWNRPGKTAEVIQNGWYHTGDMAIIDSEGFIKITGRLSRFSKIGGEMVPHLLIEERLFELIESTAGDDESVRLAVTAVPDSSKGERIVVLHKPLGIAPAELIKKLGESDLPNLWLPSADSFYQVEAIPMLGSGKLDLKTIKQLALQRAGQA